jgi:hypothetical protein
MEGLDHDMAVMVAGNNLWDDDFSEDENMSSD